MKLFKKVLALSVLSLAAFAATTKASSQVSLKADGGPTVNVGGTSYELADNLDELDLSVDGALTSRWGRQAATVQFVNGVHECAASQPINCPQTVGSYHTKLDLSLLTTGANWFRWGLRQNSGKLFDVAEGQIDIDAENGFFLNASNHYFQVLYFDNGVTKSMGGFTYDTECNWGPDCTYTFEIWMLNLNDGSVQMKIDVDGAEAYNHNTSEYAEALTGVELVKTGQMRFGSYFTGEGYTSAADQSTMAINVKGYVFKVGDYCLADALDELDLSGEGSLTSRWGRQAATVQYNKGVHECAAGQPINCPQTVGSYHTKLDVSLLTTGANWFRWGLRQNSGKFFDSADGKIDVDIPNGFYLFASNHYFQVLYFDNNTSKAMGGFTYDTECKWGPDCTYTFEIWMLNLRDGSVQMKIDVDGETKYNHNTSEYAEALSGVELVKTGQMRFSSYFTGEDYSTAAEQSTMAFNVKGYGKSVYQKPAFEIADSLTEWDISGDNALVSRWGNQDATVKYVEGSYVAQPTQPINGVQQMGSYHTKFNVNYHADNGNAFNIMLRQNSGELVADNGGVGMIDIGTRTGYEIFGDANGFQFFYNDNNSRTGLTPGWFQCDQTAGFNDPSVTYSFEIWVLNLVDGTVQIIIDFNGANVLNYNSSMNAGITPIKTGSVRMAGSFDDALSKGTTITGIPLTGEDIPTTVEGTLPTTVEVMEAPDMSGVKLTSQYDRFDVVGGVEATVDSRSLGEKTLDVKALGYTDPTINVVAAAGASYALKTDYKTEYLVGEAFANDLVVTKTVNEVTKEFPVLASEVSGFDSSTNGVKTLTVSVAGETFTATVNVWEYVISEVSKTEYVVDADYTDGDFVLDKVCGETVISTNIVSDDISSWDTETNGTKTVTFSKFDKDFSVSIDVVEYSLKSAKTAYDVGEAFAKGDIVVTKTCGEVTTDIEVEASDVSGFDTSAAGSMTLSVAKYGISVDASVAAVLTGITVEGAKANFEVGDSFDSTGLVVKANYNDNSSVDVSANATIDSSEVKMNEAGTYTVKVSYDGKEATYTVTVAAKPASAKGCGGSILATSSLVTLLGVAGIALLKRKED